MSVVIATTALALQRPGTGAVDSAACAAEACIGSSDVDKSAIDLLINIGVYKDENRIEPATAAFIQKRIGLNTDPLRNNFDHTTFSFDLSNGPCSFLHAVQTVNALSRTDAIRTALVVSSNALSMGMATSTQPYSGVAAAALLTRTDDKNRGFRDLAFYTDDDGEPAIFGYCDPGEYGPGAAGHVTIDTDAKMSERLERFIVLKIKDYLNKNNIDPSEIFFLLPSYQRVGLVREIVEATGIQPGLPADKLELNGGAHSS